MLISKTGKAQVCDYGLNPIISNPALTIAKIPGVAGPSRWLAPEIIDPLSKASPKSMRASKSADVFAFAMLAVEVFTGKVPFGNMKNESVVIQIASGKRPAKPRAAEQLGLTMEMWKFVEKCWAGNPKKRPAIDELVRTWEGFVKGHVVSSSGSSGGRPIVPRDNSRVSVSRAPGRQSRFTKSDASIVFAKEPGEPPLLRNPHLWANMLRRNDNIVQEVFLWLILTCRSLGFALARIVFFFAHYH